MNKTKKLANSIYWYNLFLL